MHLQEPCHSSLGGSHFRFPPHPTPEPLGLPSLWGQGSTVRWGTESQPPDPIKPTSEHLRQGTWLLLTGPHLKTSCARYLVGCCKVWSTGPAAALLFLWLSLFRSVSKAPGLLLFPVGSLSSHTPAPGVPATWNSSHAEPGPSPGALMRQRGRPRASSSLQSF